MTKAPQAFRTISEVSDTLDVPQHVLRFWEGKFAHIKPLKRAGGRRYYRPEDIEILRGIRTLLYAEGYTIKGVQKLLRLSGPRYVCDVGRYGLSHAGRTDASDSDVTSLDGEGEQETVITDDAAVEAQDEQQVPDDMTGDAALSTRRAKLEEALEELLALREMLRAARPKRADAA